MKKLLNALTLLIIISMLTFGFIACDSGGDDNNPPQVQPPKTEFDQNLIGSWVEIGTFGLVIAPAGTKLSDNTRSYHTDTIDFTPLTASQYYANLPGVWHAKNGKIENLYLFENTITTIHVFNYTLSNNTLTLTTTTAVPSTYTLTPTITISLVSIED